jgi:hypothetical protein
MKKVRDNMQREYDIGNHRHQYICWNILLVVLGRDTRYTGKTLPMQMDEVGGVAERLYRHIQWALNSNGVMTIFIQAETMHFGPEFMRWAGRFDAEARLAWLDRIIEMEDIK